MEPEDRQINNLFEEFRKEKDKYKNSNNMSCNVQKNEENRADKKNNEEKSDYSNSDSHCKTVAKMIY